MELNTASTPSSPRVVFGRMLCNTPLSFRARQFDDGEMWECELWLDISCARSWSVTSEKIKEERQSAIVEGFFFFLIGCEKVERLSNFLLFGSVENSSR